MNIMKIIENIKAFAVIFVFGILPFSFLIFIIVIQFIPFKPFGEVTNKIERPGYFPEEKPLQKGKIVAIANTNTNKDKEIKIVDILWKLESANMAFNMPETMKVAEIKTVNLFISQRESIPELTVQIKKLLSEPEKIYTDTVKISSTMEACLKGQGFDIKSITPDRQKVIKENIWKWEIKALEAGNKSIYLTLNALIQIGEEKEPKTILTYEKRVVVYVSFHDKALKFISGNWKYFFGAIVIPLVGYIWKKLMDGKKKRVRARKKNV